MSFSLADQLLINSGDNSTDFYLSRLYHFWFYPLKDGQESPPLITITALPTPQYSTNLILESEIDIILYRYHVLRFGEKFAIVKRTVSITANVPLSVPVFSLPMGIDSSDPIGVIYPLIPLISIKEGGFPQPSPSLAEAHNKNMSLYCISQKYKHDTSATVTGELNFTDPALPVLESMENTGLTNIFVQVRPVVTEILSLENFRQKAGALSVQYLATATVSVSDPESGLVPFSIEIKVNGQIDNYLNMFPLPAIIIPPPSVSGDLLLSFHDGSILDTINPSRIFTLDSNAYVGYPYKYGAKYANTSLIANNKVLGQGCYTNDVSGLSNFGATGVNYTIEFWASNLIPNGTASITLLSGSNIVFNITGSGSTGISVTFHGQNVTLSLPIATYPRRAGWNHYAFVREGNTVRGYFNGILINNVSFASSNLPVTSIQLGRVIGSVPASNSSFMDLNINYFAITLNATKYTSNFNPVTDTGFSSIFYYPENDTEYLV